VPAVFVGTFVALSAGFDSHGTPCTCIVPAPAVFVGTFIGERLLYMPSLGFLLLVSELTCASLLPQLLVPRVSGWVGW
jgi:hypothetical protein